MKKKSIQSVKSQSNTRRKYTNEFKREAVALAEKIGITQACEELNIQSASLYNWKQKLEYQSSKSDLEQAKDLKIAKLKRQLVEQNEELAILKKAATYFAKNLK